MKVLVTGSQGYIGSVMAPMLLKAGHTVIGFDSDLYRALHLRAGRRHRRRADHAQGRPRRRTARPRGLRCRHPSGGAVQRSARQSRSGAHLRDQSSRQRAHGRAGQGSRRVKRFLFASSCSNYGQVGRGHDRRDRRAQPGDRLWRIEGAIPSATSPSSPTTTSPRPTCARPPPTACRRGCASTSCSTISSPGRSPQGEILLKSDGTPVAPDRAHRGHLARVHRRRSRRRARPSTTRPSTSARRPTITASATSPRSSPRWCPAARLEFADDAGPDTRSYRVSFEKIARVLPRVQAAVGRQEGRRAALRRLHAAPG